MRGFNPWPVWSQIPVANRLVEVNTKTGFSLTAGSYVVRASSTQEYTANLSAATSTTATISSVTTTRAILAWTGLRSTDASIVNDRVLCTHVITNATTVTIAKGTGTESSFNAGRVLEIF